MVVKGIAIDDDIIVRNCGIVDLHNDVPSWGPSVIEEIRELSVEVIVLAVLNLGRKVCVNVVPNYCKIAVAHVARALPVEGSYWLVQEQHQSQKEAKGS